MSNSEKDHISVGHPDDADRLPDESTNTQPMISDVLTSDDNPTKASEHAEHHSKRSSVKSTSSSFRPPSVTSTIAYEQTPFVEWSVQVKQLCHSLWPPSVKEYRIQRLLGGPNNRFLGVLRSKKLGRFLWPASPPKAFEIERMRGGSFNRIIGIKIIGSENEDPIELVLRTPRYPWDSRPDREVATLDYIRQHTKISVPHIKAFDLTEENPLKVPYVIQSRVSGICLQTAINQGLSPKQWCSLAKQIAQLIQELQSLTNPTPGIIENSTKDDGVQNFTVCPFDIRRPFETEWKRRQAQSLTFSDENRKALYLYEKDTCSFLATQFGRWRAEELRFFPIDILYKDQMRQLADVASEMNAYGMFGANENCLTHMDLAPRNIMVEVGTDDFIQITGILDWDSAIFAPKFVSCRPPWWLWQDEIFPEDAMVDESNAHVEPYDPELLEVKRLFDEAVGDEYTRLAYQPQYLIARKLFDIALYGNCTNESITDIDKIIDEWAAFLKVDDGGSVPASGSGSLKSATGDGDAMSIDDGENQIESSG